MATISSMIRIQDGMSPVLRSMNKAMHSVLDSFQAMQSASNNSINIDSIQDARAELFKAEQAMDAVERQIKQASRQQDNFTKEVRESHSSMNDLVTNVRNLVGAYLGIQTVGSVVALSDQLSQTESKLNMILDDQTDINEMQQMIFQSAQDSKSAYQGTADMVARIGNNAKGVFDSNAELVKFAEILNKKYIIAGASADDMNNSLIQLTQGLGSGVLRGEELNSVFESAPNIIQTIADYLDVDIGKIREMASEGQITAEIVKNAMLSSAQETNDQFSQMSTTWGQHWTVFKNDAIMAFEPVLKKINDLANNPAMQSAISSVTNAMYGLASGVMWVVDLFESGAGFIADNWGIIEPIIKGVGIAFGIAAVAVGIYGAALVVLKGYEMAAATAGWIHNTMLVAKQGQLWNTVKALTASKIAQWGLNTAVLVFVGIFLAVIAVIYLGVWAMNTFAGTSISATGIIVGVFTALGQTLYNIVAFVWNWFAALAEFLVNLFIDPVAAVEGLFYNMVSNVLDFVISFTEGWDEAATGLANVFIDAVNIAIKAINWLIDAINLIPGIDLDHMKELEHTTSITSNLKDLRADFEKKALDSRSEDYWEAPKMEMGNVADAFNAGYNWGEGVENGIGNFMNGGNDTTKAVEDALNNSGVTDALDSTSGNAAKIAKSISASDEDIKYLRDMAEQNVVNRFTGVTVKVNMNNENHINSEMDIDGVINKLTEKVEEQLYASAEGVHE